MLSADRREQLKAILGKLSDDLQAVVEQHLKNIGVKYTIEKMVDFDLHDDSRFWVQVRLSDGEDYQFKIGRDGEVSPVKEEGVE